MDYLGSSSFSLYESGSGFGLALRIFTKKYTVTNVIIVMVVIQRINAIVFIVVILFFYAFVFYWQYVQALKYR